MTKKNTASEIQKKRASRWENIGALQIKSKRNRQ